MSSSQPQNRLLYLDNLKVALTLQVVAHHAGQAYGFAAGSWPVDDPASHLLMHTFFSLNAAFFMGFFFFLSGCFVEASYERKGAFGFLRDRFLRFGIPLAVCGFFLFVPVSYFASGSELSFGEYYLRVYLGQWQIQLGPLWFLTHLLVYGCGYALYRRLQRSLGGTGGVPGHREILVYLVVLTTVTALVRIYFPIDRWWVPLGVIPVELARAPQYLSLFVFGIVAARRGWLRRLPDRLTAIWLGIGVAALVLRIVHDAAGWQLIAAGGPGWRNWVWSFWESTICVGVVLGLLGLFRRRCDRQGRFLALLSANAYTIYLVHVLVVVLLQHAVQELELALVLKFLLVTVLGVAASLGVSVLVRTLPLARRIL